MTQTLFAWLGTYPGFPSLALDTLPPGPGAGLFPQGLQVVSTARDVLGNEHRRLRLTALVRLHCPRDPLGEETGGQAILDGFAQWATRTAPPFGEMQTVAVTRARQTALDAAALARYEATVTVEFTQ